MARLNPYDERRADPIGGGGGPVSIPQNRRVGYIFEPKTLDGRPLYGAVISGYINDGWEHVVHTSQGETKLTLPPEPTIRIQFLGRTLFLGEFDEFREIATVSDSPRGTRQRSFTVDISFDVQGLGLPFTGAHQALVIGDDLLITWTPEQVGTVEISTAATASDLFTENSATATADIREGLSRVPNITDHSVAAVRKAGTSRAHGVVTIYREPETPDNSSAEPVQLTADIGAVGRRVLVRQTTPGHVVSFSAIGASILQSNSRFAYVEIQSAEASITAEADGSASSYTQALTFHNQPPPNTPEHTLHYISGSDAVVEWEYDGPSKTKDTITFFVQAGPDKDSAARSLPLHTYDMRVAFSPQSGHNTVLVRAVDGAGRMSAAEEINFTYEGPANTPVARRVQAIPPVHVPIGGGAVDFSLSDYIQINEQGASSEMDAWTQAQIDVFNAGQSAVERKDTNDDRLVVSVNVSSYQPVLFRIRREGFRPFWAGFLTRRTDNLVKSLNFSGAKVGEFGRTIDVNIESFVGNTPAFVVTDTTRNTLRFARPLSITSQGVSARAFNDGTPQYAIMQGSRGAGLFMLSDEPDDRTPSLPYIPDAPDKVQYQDERTWKAFDPFDEKGHRFSVVETTSGELYQVNRRREPLRILEESEADLSVTALTAWPTSATSLQVQWRLENDITGSEVRLPRSVEVERLSLVGDTYEPTGLILGQASGVAGAAISNLPAAAAVLVRVGESTKALRLNPTPPPIDVTGQAIDGGEYQYRYVIDDSISEWVDEFGNSYSANDIEVVTTQLRDEHHLTLFGDPRREPNDDLSSSFVSPEYHLPVATQWISPKEGFEIDGVVVIGQNVDPSPVPAPEFGYVQYAEKTTKDLPTNVFDAGTVKAEAEGYLPFGLQGALEDFVEINFVDPRGEKHGDMVELENPTELGIRVTITTDGAQTPILYGVRVRYES